MKNFLKKLPVLISFCVVTALFLGLTLGFSVRPISKGLNYSGTQIKESKTENITLKFKNDKEVVFQYEDFTREFWYIREGNKFFTLIKSDAIASVGFDEYVKRFKADKEQWDAAWANENLFTINAFKVTNESLKIDASSGGAIALTVVFSILTAVGIAGTTLSALFYVKDKKTKKPVES